MSDHRDYATCWHCGKAVGSGSETGPEVLVLWYNHIHSEYQPRDTPLPSSYGIGAHYGVGLLFLEDAALGRDEHLFAICHKSCLLDSIHFLNEFELPENRFIQDERETRHYFDSTEEEVREFVYRDPVVYTLSESGNWERTHGTS